MTEDGFVSLVRTQCSLNGGPAYECGPCMRALFRRTFNEGVEQATGAAMQWVWQLGNRNDMPAFIDLVRKIPNRAEH